MLVANLFLPTLTSHQYRSRHSLLEEGMDQAGLKK
jgi:hypothetical protein